MSKSDEIETQIVDAEVAWIMALPADEQIAEIVQVRGTATGSKGNDRGAASRQVRPLRLAFLPLDIGSTTRRCEFSIDLLE